MRKFTLSILLGVIALLFGLEGYGQVEIFNLDGGGSFPAGWTATNNNTSNDIDKGSYYLIESGNPEDVINTAVYDLSAYTSAEFSVNITSFGSGNHNPLKVEVSYNGGSTFSQTSLTPITTGSYVTRIITLTSISNQIQLRFTVNATSGRGIRMRNIILKASGTAVIKAEPTNHPTNFTCASSGSNQIDLSWVDATGGQVPDRYLVMWSDVNFGAITNPTDLVAEPDSPNAQNVAYGVQTLEVTGLNPNTTYYFKIFPYTNSGSDIDYKTGVGVLQTSCTTDDGPCVFENFDNSNAPSNSSYSNGSFVGNNSITWTYVKSRDENGDANSSGISGKAIMLQKSSENSKITSSPVPGGISDFSVKLYKGFTGTGPRQVELFVNGVSQGLSATFDDYDEHIFTVSGIDIPGDVVIEIRNNTSRQIIIDDISWTCYTPTPTVQFESSGISISENSSSVEFCVEILYPDASTATSVDIALTGTGFSHLSPFSTITVTFPAGSYEEQCITIPITNDLICGNSQDYVFNLQNVTGISGVEIGSESTFTLKIIDDDSSSGTIVRQGFEEDATETYTYTKTGSGAIGTLNTGTPNNQRIRSGSKSFQSKNTTSELTFSGQDISSFTNIELEIWNSSISHDGAGNGADAGDFIKVYVSETPSFSSIPNISIEGNSNAKYGMNGSLELSVIAPATISHTTGTGPLPINTSPSKLIISIPDSWNNLYTKIEVINNAANEVWCLDDIRLRGITCDACVDPTISSISPNSGPKETVVTVIGTNFITGGSLTDVQFGGVSAASYNVISDTELTAVVPADASSGVVKVLRSSCNDISSETFTFLQEDCETGTANLIISELCDSQQNYHTDRYIEIYNPSDVSVNLDGWVLYALSNESDITDQSGTSWVLFGNIGPGLAVTCGYTSPENGGPHTFKNPLWHANTPEQGSSQWNGDGRDGAALYNGSVLVDGVLLKPGVKGGVYNDRVLYRNNNICSPNPNSSLSEWTVSEITSAGSGSSTPREHLACVLLTGADPSIITETTPNLTEPICNKPIINVTAETESEPGISYQWYYNDGSASWTAIIDNAVFSGATTHTLSITNLIGLEGYQFYCRLITDLACINYSRAIQVEVLPNDKIYFKSNNSGLWSDPETWEFSDAIFGSYSGACLYPTKESAVHIKIEPGQTVTYDLPNTDVLPSVQILSGGTLQTQGSSNLIIDDMGAGAELIVEGTFIDNANSTYGIKFLNGATWKLGLTGTIIKTNTSSAAVYGGDNYEGGISTIPTSSNWIYRRIGTGNVSVASIGMVYPNLSFENYGAFNYNTTNTFYNFSGNSSSVRIKGDLNIGMDGPGTYTVMTLNTHSDPILIEGSIHIGEGSSMVNGDIGVSGGTGFEVRGDMDLKGTINLTTGSETGIGVLKLSGSPDINITGTQHIRANHIIIDKAHDSNIFSELNFTAVKSAEFVKGIIRFNNALRSFNFNENATVSGASNNSFVNGKVNKTAVVGENFTFPIGDSNADGDFYQPARIFGHPSLTNIQAQYFIKAHPYAGAYYDGHSNNPNDNHEIGNCDYWTVNKTIGGDVQLALKFRNDNPDYCNVVGAASFMRIASLNAANLWDLTDSAPEGDEIEMDVRVGTPITGGQYGDFTFYSNAANLNVLPIELISFTATPENQKVQTQWTTHSETNNAFFTVERSADARAFHSIGEVAGAGNSHSTRDYKFTDHRPLSGVSYYRLKQTDFDGHYTYTDIKAVTFKETNEFSLDLTYRDANDLNLVYKSISPYILVEIFDVLGKRVFTQVAENYGGRSVLNPTLGRGAYVVRISSGDKSDTGKIVW